MSLATDFLLLLLRYIVSNFIPRSQGLSLICTHLRSSDSLNIMVSILSEKCFKIKVNVVEGFRFYNTGPIFFRHIERVERARDQMVITNTALI